MKPWSLSQSNASTPPDTGRPSVGYARSRIWSTDELAASRSAPAMTRSDSISASTESIRSRVRVRALSPNLYQGTSWDLRNASSWSCIVSSWSWAITE